jgi:cysteine desulfurase
VLYLGAKGIACSAGSACSTDKQKSSHVLEALGLSDERVGSAVRFSLGKSTTKKDIDRVMKVLPAIVEKVIKMKQA